MKGNSLLTDNRGISLITAIIFIVVIGFLGTVASFLFTTQTRSTVDQMTSVRALYIAEGGLERSLKSYKGLCVSGTSSYTGETNVSLGGGTFTIAVYNTDFNGAALPTGQNRLTSTGTYGNSSRVVEQIVKCSSVTPLAIIGQKNIKVGNNAVIDCGPSYTPQYCTRFNINNCPCTMQDVVDLQPIPVPSPTPPAPPGGCSLGNNVMRTWPAGTYYCSGTLTLNNNSSLNLSGSVTLYTNGINLSQNAVINWSGSSANFFAISTGTVYVGNNSGIRGAVYAPGERIDIENNGVIIGTVAGGIVNQANSVDLANNALIQYDSVAGTSTPEYDIAYDVSVSWREVPP